VERKEDWLSRYIMCDKCAGKAEYTLYKRNGECQYLCEYHAQDIKREIEERKNV